MEIYRKCGYLYRLNLLRSAKLISLIELSKRCNSMYTVCSLCQTRELCLWFIGKSGVIKYQLLSKVNKSIYAKVRVDHQLATASCSTPPQTCSPCYTKVTLQSNDDEHNCYNVVVFFIYIYLLNRMY